MMSFLIVTLITLASVVEGSCHQPPQGPPGPQGPIGPEGPAGPQSWVQLYDRNYTNELTSNSYINLSNEGINSNYTTGGYTLASTHSVTNDTLIFPEPGHYLVQIHLRASFLLPLTPPTFGDVYQILFNIVDRNDSTVGSLVFNGIIPNDPNAILDVDLSSNILIYDASVSPQIKIRLSNFDFSNAFENQLSVFDIAIQVQKWEQ